MSRNSGHDVMQLPSWDEYEDVDYAEDPPTDDPVHNVPTSSSPGIEEPSSSYAPSSPLPRVDDGDSQPGFTGPSLPAGFLTNDTRGHPDDPEDPNDHTRRLPITDCAGENALPQIRDPDPGPMVVIQQRSRVIMRDEAPSLPDEELRAVRDMNPTPNGPSHLPPPEPNEARVIRFAGNGPSLPPDLTLPETAEEVSEPTSSWDDNEDIGVPGYEIGSFRNGGGAHSLPHGMEHDIEQEDPIHPLEMPIDDDVDDVVIEPVLQPSNPPNVGNIVHLETHHNDISAPQWVPQIRNHTNGFNPRPVFNGNRTVVMEATSSQSTEQKRRRVINEPPSSSSSSVSHVSLEPLPSSSTDSNGRTNQNSNGRGTHTGSQSRKRKQEEENGNSLDDGDSSSRPAQREIENFGSSHSTPSVEELTPRCGQLNSRMEQSQTPQLP